MTGFLTTRLICNEIKLFSDVVKCMVPYAYSKDNNIQMKARDGDSTEKGYIIDSVHCNKVLHKLPHMTVNKHEVKDFCFKNNALVPVMMH